MTTTNDHFEHFPPHTRFKHLILRAYLQAWAMKQLRHRQLWYVDAFAGRGEDSTGAPGSPRIAVEVAEQLRDEGRARGTNSTLELCFFEADADNAKHLASVVPAGLVTHAALPSVLEELDARIAKCPALYFLDPYGVGLSATAIQRILIEDRREVLLLFNDIGAVRHLGVINAKPSDAERDIATMPPCLFPDISEREANEIRLRAQKRNDALDLTKPRAEAILTEAWGDRSWKIHLAFLKDADKRDYLLMHYAEKLEAWGARYVLPIPVRSEDNRHQYYLIHATKSAAGYRAIKEAVDSALRKGQIGTAAVEAIRAEVSVPTEALLRMVEYKFQGRALVNNDELRDFLLVETPAYPSDIPAVKSALAGRRLPGKQHNYQFTL